MKAEKGRKTAIGFLLSCFLAVVLPVHGWAHEINEEGWPVPDLNGLVPYSISVKKIDSVEKIVEKFYTPDGGHVARISGNGKVFAYAVDSDREPPIDYLILDSEGHGKYTQKFEAEESYSIPDWISN